MVVVLPPSWRKVRSSLSQLSSPPVSSLCTPSSVSPLFLQQLPTPVSPLQQAVALARPSLLKLAVVAMVALVGAVEVVAIFLVLAVVVVVVVVTVVVAAVVCTLVFVFCSAAAALATGAISVVASCLSWRRRRRVYRAGARRRRRRRRSLLLRFRPRPFLLLSVAAPVIRSTRLAAVLSLVRGTNLTS